MKTLRALTVFVLLISATTVLAASGGNGSRANSKFGFTFGVGTEPLGSLIGGNLHYNIFNFLQVRVGYGTVSTDSVDAATGVTTTVTATSIGGGARLFIPGWNFSPFVGVGFSNVSFTGTISLGGTSISSTDGLSLTYAVGGLEWQTGYGFTFGLQAQMSFSAVTVPGNPTPVTIPIIPGVYLGWFF